jgi:hypothetical protein
LTDKWLCENTVISILDYVEYFRHTFTRACVIEHDNLKQSQVKMKQWYDKDSMLRQFKPDKKYIVIAYSMPSRTSYIFLAIYN